MANYDYKIGSTVGNMKYVEELLAASYYFPPPTGIGVQEFSVYRSAVSGQSFGDGFPTCTWHFDYLSVAMYATLIAYIGAGNQSTSVYIRTRNVEGTYSTYTAIMHKPKVGEDMQWEIGGWRDVEVRFTKLVLVS